MNDISAAARLIAFYLPQFHPIAENDEWWGRGFTEWTNVAKAKPLYIGHPQPNLPADLGFYDLRVPETREAQAALAREYGIEGFCYWHYWFDGKRILERPFNEVLSSGKPDFPFCLGWANESWTGIWHGCPDRVLVEQTYSGAKDEEAHFNSLLPAFTDSRYLKVAERPIFFIYKPHLLPDSKRFIEHWRELALKSGLKGLYFVGNTNLKNWDYEQDGFDAMIKHNPGVTAHPYFNRPHRRVVKFLRRQIGKIFSESLGCKLFGLNTMPYKKYIYRAIPGSFAEREEYPCVVPNWDNTPRSGIRGYVLRGSTPELFELHLRKAVAQVAHRNPERRIIFIKSWNEWAEGNYLEPDRRFGRRYLEACKAVVLGGTSSE